ncbi:MAG: hypothetical protein PHD82_11185 [Candidatus Riflebacteria bacterium]|jgi:hypothetical protein|nr:hypothetical protein [Candidatus Riflebacteria bacterium]
MTSNETENNNPQTPETGILETLENLFDWNLIALVSAWIFLLTTFFLIFAS